MSRFPKPILDTVTLENGDTITVRRTLTHGETTDMYKRLEARDAAGTPIRDPLTGAAILDSGRAMDERILAHLTDWNFRDDAGEAVPFRGLSIDERADAIRNLDPESAIEISRAITANGAKYAQKKTDPVGPLSLATSR